VPPRQDEYTSYQSKHNHTQRWGNVVRVAGWSSIGYLFTVVAIVANFFVIHIGSSSEDAEAATSLLLPAMLTLQAALAISRHKVIGLRPTATTRALRETTIVFAVGACSTFLMWAFVAHDVHGIWDRMPMARSVGVVVAWLPLTVLADRFRKLHRLRQFKLRQQYLRLAFTTRLGLHSPVGELEEVLPDVTAARKPPSEKVGFINGIMHRWLGPEGESTEYSCECCPRP
jgi:hypothetical protein